MVLSLEPERLLTNLLIDEGLEWLLKAPVAWRRGVVKSGANSVLVPFLSAG